MYTGTIKQYVYQGPKARNWLIKRHSAPANCPKRDNNLRDCGHERTTNFYLVRIPESGHPKQEPENPMMVDDPALIPGIIQHVLATPSKKRDTWIMNCRLSVIVPNRNGEKTIGLCLEALFNSDHDSFEVIVVDDCSTDNSVALIEQFPCTLVGLTEHAGAAEARNRGARQSTGALLFFIDADCLVQKETLAIAEQAAKQQGKDVVIGGTYTCRPVDQHFFSLFQSIFIHFSELKNSLNPDYIAAHAMILSADTFRISGGFPEDFLPIIEDVEFSHRLRRRGYNLKMEPKLQVRHIFQYRSLADSMKNGFIKSKYWTIYSLGNRDLLADSGTASFALKINVLALFLILASVAIYVVVLNVILLFGALMVLLLNAFINRELFTLFYKTGGLFFALRAAMYYMLLYPLAVGAGGLSGLAAFFFFDSSSQPGVQS